MYNGYYYLGTSHRYRENVNKAYREPGASPRTTSQSLLDLHENRDLDRKLSLEVSRQIVASTTFET
jgi:hypothetical protein